MNEAFVRAYLANDNPLGQTIKVGKDEWHVIGVCRDVKYTDIRTDAPPTVYFSYRQSGVGSAYFAVRTALPPLSIVPAVRKAVSAINPNIPLDDITTQEAVRDGRIAPERMFATLVSALAMLAALLSCIGLYGLMSYSVARRTSEIGVRMALGATPKQIAAPIMREAALLAGAGIVTGIPMVFILSRFIRNQLYGVRPLDPIILVAGSLLMLGIAVFAACLPAQRAARINPLDALRSE